MQLTIRARLFALAAVTLTAMLALGFSNYRGMTEAVDGLTSVFATSRALRTHLEGDMMHDALRADVLSALLAQTPEEWTSVNDSLREHADHFREMIKENDSNVTDPELRAALHDVGPVLESYIRSAEGVISTAHDRCRQGARDVAGVPGDLRRVGRQARRHQRSHSSERARR